MFLVTQIQLDSPTSSIPYPVRPPWIRPARKKNLLVLHHAWSPHRKIRRNSLATLFPSHKQAHRSASSPTLLLSPRSSLGKSIQYAQILRLDLFSTPLESRGGWRPKAVYTIRGADVYSEISILTLQACLGLVRNQIGPKNCGLIRMRNC